MDRMFTLNGKSIVAKDFDFNLICDLEDMGVAMEDMQKKPMSMVRAYVAKCLNSTAEVAGKAMEMHLISGGKFDDVMKVLSEKMEESDFFRSLNQTEAKKNPTSTKEKK